MKCYPEKHHRRSIRLKGYDYNRQGYYYITICTKERSNFFSGISNNAMKLSPTGKIANDFWIAIPRHFKHITLDKYVIMPNHIHGIIVVGNAIVGNADLRSLLENGF